MSGEAPQPWRAKCKPREGSVRAAPAANKKMKCVSSLRFLSRATVERCLFKPQGAVRPG